MLRRAHVLVLGWSALSCGLDSGGLGTSGGTETGEHGSSGGSSITTFGTSGTAGSGTGTSAGVTTDEDPTTEGSTAGSSGVDDVPWLAPYRYRKRLEIQPAGTAFEDFTVGVLLHGDADLLAGARPDGFDIVFTAGDGQTLLPYERERFDAEGNLVAWVRSPLAGSTPTALYVYYGDVDAFDGQQPEQAWNGRVAGLWHLAEDPLDPAPQYRDSSANATHGTAAGTVATAPGIAGRGVQFTGVGGQVSLGDPPDESLDFGLGGFSYGQWVFISASTGSFDMPWYKGGSSIGDVGYDMELGTGAWRAGVASSSAIAVGDFGIDTEFLGRWVHLVVVVDRTANVLRLFADGQLVDEDDIAGLGSLSSGVPARIGRVDAYFVNGIVDEVRIYDAALSPAWIATEYANLTDPSFLEVGPQQQSLE